MYNNYFGLSEPPFSIAPDPRYLYLSQQHREALAHLLYGIQNNSGFVLLTGEVGTGKTTVCRCLLEQLPDNTELAVILNPKFSVLELLQAICDELRIPYPDREERLKYYVDALNQHLLKTHAQGGHTVLIIDEAQNLSGDVLEQLRLLTNLETNTSKLLQIILLGQPELLDKLEKPELRQLAQRITARFHLGPLSEPELQAYVKHRLSIAGLEGELFSPAIVKRLHRLTGGIPRLVNVLCDRALLGTYVHRHTKVKRSTLEKAAREVFGIRAKPVRPQPGTGLPRWLLGGASLAAASFAAALYFNPSWLTSPMSLEQARQPVPLALPATPAPQPEPEQPPAPEPLLSNPANWQWPEDIPLELNAAIAYRALFKLWGLDYKPADNPIVCQFAREHGLGCLFQQGDIDSLRRLNRPAVLKMFNADGQEFHVTLLSMTGHRAQILLAGEMKQVELDALALWWPGSYTLFWQMPPGYDSPIRPGSAGSQIRWLDQRLAALQKRSPYGEDTYFYDDRLVRQVRQFQFSQGIKADGVVGPQTTIHLNTLADGQQPQLLLAEGG
ncbi:AAA family ATPase [Gallaecimonas sp. GXIMD4217]|uniref:ExeA family protein n=1 Tax=Gallaecimonas sp. GXIMD4217 TaxID=3131927 RepID=UPI00311ACF39